MLTTILLVFVHVNKFNSRNTVLGRICLLERLNYDEDDGEKVDIYFKPRLAMFFFSLLSGLHTGYIVKKVNEFKQGFCLAQTTFSCLGGSR